MAISRISVNIDEDVKQNAQRIFSEIGLDMTTAIDSFLRTVVREERIPYDLRTERAYRESVHQAYINDELDKSLLEAADANTEWTSRDEMKERLARRREARSHA
ncbi:MAG: type II toxin-antitoxin system RelB/DinJ family antitoxin [Clostridiales bacterium]|nr:type II toxin-antitoxin system RelB/DinJ family antitoxin [Clostridiales bacterium]